jgi:hypothetical protein
METVYTAYTKLLDYKTYYFVKRFSTFPEFKNVSPMLEAYGMHTDFEKACNIAGVHDVAVKERLYKEAQSTLPQARVVELPGISHAAKTAAG